jgi:hypothetical protein
LRISRTRIALRAVLLAAGGGFMLWRAIVTLDAARGLSGSEALLGSRFAVVSALMGTLALLTAAIAALSLRQRRRNKTLQLGDVACHAGAHHEPRPPHEPTVPERPGRSTP